MSHTDDTLNPGETIIKIVHRHIINLLPVIISTALVFVALLIATFQIGLRRDDINKILPVGWVSLGVMIVMVLMVVILLISIFIYRQNRLIITNQNIMQIEQYGLFNRVVSKLSLDRIEDVTANRKGFIATVFNFGNIIIETAGEQENFVFEQAPNPTPLVDLINRIHTDLNAARGPE